MSAADWFPEPETTTPGPATRSDGTVDVNTGAWSLPPDNADGPNRYLYDVAIAPAWRRLLSLFIDLVVSVYIPSLLIGERNGVVWIALAGVFVNSVMQPFGGVSIGKKLMQIQAVYPVYYNGGKTLARSGPGRTLRRVLLHAVDSFLLLGFFFAFANRRFQRTTADYWTKVIHIDTKATGGPDQHLPRAPVGSTPIT